MCRNRNVYQRLIQEIGAWSATNFGTQESKWFTSQRSPDSTTPMFFILHHTAPLLGIIEESGELTRAVEQQNSHEIVDAIGDILVYLADYIFRLGLDADIIDWSNLSSSAYRTVFTDRDLLKTIGWLSHINLKRHQGIRGYDGDKFFVELRSTLTDLLIILRLIYVSTHPKEADHTQPLKVLTWEPAEATDALIAIVGNTWLHVQQRNWKADPQTGGSV